MAEASAQSPSNDHPARGGHRAVHRRRLRAVNGGAPPVALGHRIWLHVDGVRMFGPGMLELLEHVAATGSLHQAAKLMDMSYTKAWHLLREAEEHLGWKLVERQVGGVAGGGTSLTPTGDELVRRFAALMAETDATMKATFTRLFHDWPPVGSSEVDE